MLFYPHTNFRFKLKYQFDSVSEDSCEATPKPSKTIQRKHTKEDIKKVQNIIISKKSKTDNLPPLNNSKLNAVFSQRNLEYASDKFYCLKNPNSHLNIL